MFNLRFERVILDYKLGFQFRCRGVRQKDRRFVQVSADLIRSATNPFGEI
jgi:hypothetical protein